MKIAPSEIQLVTRFVNQKVALVWNRYMNGRLALEFVDPKTGEPISRATVNIDNEPLAEDETFIKSYMENDGMIEALTAFGIIERTGRVVKSGFANIEVCRWLVQPNL